MSDALNRWDNQTALILGASGFCGVALCDVLRQMGARVVAFDQACHTTSPDDFVEGDICDLPLLRQVLKEHSPQTVFLLAAQPLVGLSNKEPLGTAQTNIMGTYTVLEAVRELGDAPKLVFASSGAYYGATNATTAIPEEAPALVAGNIYAPTKAAADLAVRCYAKIYGLRAATCRWMNTYGPGDGNFSRIVPATMKRLSQGKHGLIDGTDGTNVLEMLHIRDMIGAYLRVAERLDDEAVRGQAFNFGGGTPLELRFVVSEATRAWNAVHGTQIDEEPETTGPKIASVKYLDIEKARRVLDWTPQIPLFEGLCETARWYGEFFGGNGRSLS